MSKAQALRALVSERLAAAAEDIFVLFERTLVEYEEELSRAKQETRRKQQLLDSALSPRTDLVCGNVLTPPAHPGPGLNHEVFDTPWMKKEEEEQSVKYEEEQLNMPLVDSRAVFVKKERSLTQTEETQANDLSSEPLFNLTRPSDAWGPSFSLSSAQTGTEADKDNCHRVQVRDSGSRTYLQREFAPETSTSVHKRDSTGAEGNKQKKMQCPFCRKTFKKNESLDRHVRVHTGERPFSCAICEKTFTDQSTFRRHNKVVHSGEKTFVCSVCKKSFAHKYSLEYHRRTHTGEKPYSCPACEKTFADHSTFRRHIRTHTGEQPFSCSVCKKTFARKDNLRTHMSIHSFSSRTERSCS